MPQILDLGKGKFITIDRMWVDGGKDPQYGLVGGNKVLISAAERPKPKVLQIKDQFFYEDLKPVCNAAHVDWLAEPHRTKAIKFIAAGVAKPVKLLAKKPVLKPSKKRLKPIKIDEDTFEAVVGPDN
jgi:hypothetical protein